MKKINLILSFLLIIVLFISCKPNNSIEQVESVCSDNVKVERLYKSHHYFIEKVTINDTLVNYVMVGFNRKGMVKLN